MLKENKYKDASKSPFDWPQRSFLPGFFTGLLGSVGAYSTYKVFDGLLKSVLPKPKRPKNLTVIVDKADYERAKDKKSFVVKDASGFWDIVKDPWDAATFGIGVVPGIAVGYSIIDRLNKIGIRQKEIDKIKELEQSFRLNVDLKREKIKLEKQLGVKNASYCSREKISAEEICRTYINGIKDGYEASCEKMARKEKTAGNPSWLDYALWGTLGGALPLSAIAGYFGAREMLPVPSATPDANLLSLHYSLYDEDEEKRQKAMDKRKSYLGKSPHTKQGQMLEKQAALPTLIPALWHGVAPWLGMGGLMLGGYYVANQVGKHMMGTGVLQDQDRGYISKYVVPSLSGIGAAVLGRRLYDYANQDYDYGVNQLNTALRPDKKKSIKKKTSNDSSVVDNIKDEAVSIYDKFRKRWIKPISSAISNAGDNIAGGYISKQIDTHGKDMLKGVLPALSMFAGKGKKLQTPDWNAINRKDFTKGF